MSYFSNMEHAYSDFRNWLASSRVQRLGIVSITRFV